ncbi:MAG: hypothetical protein NTV21_01225 [Planctomycetota bacterium]|nr:hypothetical protein [Planctomycetota bacterium]
MNHRKLLALVALLTVAVVGTAAWYVSGELQSAQERFRERRAPVPTSQAMPPGRIVGPAPVQMPESAVATPRGRSV